MTAELEKLLRKHLKHVHSGKVRETFELGKVYGVGLLLVVATDRVSAFDFIFGQPIPRKGEILTAMNIFWRRLFPRVVNHDLVAFGAGIDEFLMAPELKHNSELQKRGIVVRKLEMIPIEFIFRDYLTGSGWKDYQDSAPNHVLCGHPLAVGLHDGSILPERLFTPSTKAVVGHDENISAMHVGNTYGRECSDVAYSFFGGTAQYAHQCGIIVADTKMELGYYLDKHGDRQIAIGDEVITPDSSRFWDVDEYAVAKADRKPPGAMDKQFLRDYAKTLGIHKRKPELPDDVEWVRNQIIPEEILGKTSELYHKVQERLLCCKLSEYQARVMGITNP